MRVQFCLTDVYRRQRDFDAFVQVPELGRNRVRVVRVGHRHGQTERLVGLVAHTVEQVLVGLENHFLIEIELVRAHTGTGLQHRRHVVVPAGPYIGFVPVHGPAIVGRIDVAGQPLLVAVQLIGAAKMHFAGQGGVVTQ